MVRHASLRAWHTHTHTHTHKGDYYVQQANDLMDEEGTELSCQEMFCLANELEQTQLAMCLYQGTDFPWVMSRTFIHFSAALEYRCELITSDWDLITPSNIEVKSQEDNEDLTDDAEAESSSSDDAETSYMKDVSTGNSSSDEAESTSSDDGILRRPPPDEADIGDDGSGSSNSDDESTSGEVQNVLRGKAAKRPRVERQHIYVYVNQRFSFVALRSQQTTYGTTYSHPHVPSATNHCLPIHIGRFAEPGADGTVQVAYGDGVLHDVSLLPCRDITVDGKRVPKCTVAGYREPDGDQDITATSLADFLATI